MKMKPNATFVQVWDGGSVSIRTNCHYDADTNTVSDIESSETGIDTLDETYVEYQGESIFTFKDDEGNFYVGGQESDEAE